jgi:hypothetical protein
MKSKVNGTSKKEAGQHVSNDMWILKLRVIFSADNVKAHNRKLERRCEACR